MSLLDFQEVLESEEDGPEWRREEEEREECKWLPKITELVQQAQAEIDKKPELFDLKASRALEELFNSELRNSC